MTRLSASGPSESRLPRASALCALLLAAFPAAAAADVSAGGAIPVGGVPAYSVPPVVGAPGMAPPAYAPVAPAYEGPVASEAVGVARRVVEDRVAERGYFAPTALVAPRGTTTFTMQAPLLPGASLRLDRSFSDRLSLGVGVIGILADDQLVGVGSVHGKYQLWRGRRAALAATLSLISAPEDDSGDETFTLGVPGLAASLCTSDACRTLITVDVQALAGVSDEVLPIVGGVSIASGLKRQLIAEIHTTTADQERVWVGFIGGRFIGRSLALDVGLGFAAVQQTSDVGDCIDFCGEDAPENTSLDGGAYPFIALSKRL